MRKKHIQWKYFGCDIFRHIITGMYYTYIGDGFIHADTLGGMREMIRNRRRVTK